MKILHKLPLTLLLLVVGVLFFSCQKDDDPGPEQVIVDKWWCPDGNYAQQYFGADGAWQQRLRPTDTPDTGTWILSADGKTINITDVVGGSTTQLFTQWSYSVTTMEANRLDLSFSGIPISFQPCP